MKDYFFCKKNETGEYELLELLTTGRAIASMIQKEVERVIINHPEVKENLYLLVDGVAIKIR